MRYVERKVLMFCFIAILKYGRGKHERRMSGRGVRRLHRHSTFEVLGLNGG